VLRHRRFVFGTGLLLFVLVTGFTLFQRRSYTSAALFMPQSSSENSLLRLSGLAAQFGITVPTQDAGSSPAFYADLLRSREILREVVLAPYVPSVGRDSTRGTLVELYRIKEDSPAARRDAAVRKLRDHISVKINHETGVVTLQATTAWPSLSQQVAARMVELVSQFNMRTRQTRAGAERRFIEGRLGEAKDSLSQAEDRLQAFLQRNRDFRSAPQLAFEHERLERQVAMQQQVFTSLAQGYEQARIDEVRNTPVITIIEPPDLPTRPDSRLLLLKGVLALLAGLLAGTFAIAVRHAFGGVFSTETTPAAPSTTQPGLEPVSPWPSAARERGSARS
jgi:uncharacterized protein involved in exopolysaccharide biosynthesis